MGEEIIITGQLSLIAVLLIAVTILLNHWLANSRSQKDRRFNIGRKVVDALSPELNALRHTDQDARTVLTSEAFKKHDSAIRNFLPHLSWVDRFRMRRAWRKLAYHKKDKKAQIPFYAQYADCGSLDKRRIMKPLAIKRIQKIIDLANK